ncbi:MAG: CapA family protein [Pseudomonadota bacterium]
MSVETPGNLPVSIKIFLCGDVMTGRGIDQILPHPNPPKIYESYMHTAAGYVEIAQRVNGPIPKPVNYSYIWGDALFEWQRMAADVKIINLETSVTRSDDYWQGKGINYRMHPENIACLTAAKIDCCVLANNHILDWGYAGLTETLDTLQQAKLQYVGAGENQAQAAAPVVLEVGQKGRVIVLSFGCESSGIPRKWQATVDKAGVNLLEEFSNDSVDKIAQQIRQVKQVNDIVVFSIHWGGNWGYEIPQEQIDFAHNLIDHAAVDIIHGHSSHHVKGLEIYNGKPILYGCGDFLNDYEGIGSYKQYRGDLALMYFVNMQASTGKLISLEMIPTQVKRFQIHRTTKQDAQWLTQVLQRECAKFGTSVDINADQTISLSIDS